MKTLTCCFFFQAFSVFFICIALTSDMICFFFIPVHWLFFAASTYVWVQYVWHTGMLKTNVLYVCMYVYMYVCQDIVFCYISIRESILYIDGNSF